ncbi:MAG: aspartate aminotransferase family protein [Alphaproteobacteria bacterium]
MTMEKTNEFLTRDGLHVFHSLHDQSVVREGKVWVRGEGHYLFDADGGKCIDGLSGLWNVILGHCRPELASAASRQLSELDYCSGYSGSTNPRAIELAERIAALTYESINRFFFTSGGGESTDTTIKIARYYWKMLGQQSKTKTICLQNAYHGTTLGAMAATGMPKYWTAFEPRFPGFVHIPNHDAYRYEVPEGADLGTVAADELETAILREGPENVAMFLVESIPGGGVNVPPDGYFTRIREICDQYDVLLAVDEVISGFGRTGEMFALRHWGVEPDIIQFAKGVSNGAVPLGGVGVSDDIAEVIETRSRGADMWMHCFTYSGHPVACAVGLATIEVIENERLVDNAREMGIRMRDLLSANIGQNPHLGDIRGLGLFSGLELVEDRETKQPFDQGKQIGPRIVGACLKRGLYIRGRGDVLYLGPPLTADPDLIDLMVEKVCDATLEILSEP